MKTFKAFAPATIANLNVGFDILGLALQNIGDTVEITPNQLNYNRITEIVNGANLPFDVSKNSCSVVIQKMQESINDLQGLDIKITKGFASGSGMGSSSASSAAAAMAYNLMQNNRFSKLELIQFAGEGERIACGAAHFDNVAPAIMKGITLVKDYNCVLKLPVLEDLFALVIFQQIEIKTAYSRSILPQNIPLKDTVSQMANIGSFVSSLYTNDYKLFSKSMIDLIAEPHRSNLIPNFKEMKAIALQNEAIAFGISGSGPSVFCLVKGKNSLENIQIKIENYLNNKNVVYESYTSKIE
jgi:homoserine kinase